MEEQGLNSAVIDHLSQSPTAWPSCLPPRKQGNAFIYPFVVLDAL